MKPPQGGRHRFHQARPNQIQMQDPALRGGVELRQIPVLPWNTFVGYMVHIHKDDKVQPAILDPQPVESPEEAFELMRFILAAQMRKPMAVQWDTVPKYVRRHFRAKDAKSADGA